jgi:hypothetical protein
MPVPVMAVAALAQLGLSGYQIYKGAQLKKEAGERPDYETPKEILQSLNMAQRQAYEGLPAEQKKQFVENLRAMQAGGLSQLGDRKSGLAGVGGLAQTATQGYRDLLAQDAAARQKAQLQYRQALETTAGYKDLEFQTNELQKYQQTLAESKGLTGAGINNAFGAAGGLGQAAAYGSGMDKYNYNNNMSQSADFLGDSARLTGSELELDLNTNIGSNPGLSQSSNTSVFGGGGISPLGGTSQWY